MTRVEPNGVMTPFAFVEVAMLAGLLNGWRRARLGALGVTESDIEEQVVRGAKSVGVDLPPVLVARAVDRIIERWTDAAEPPIDNLDQYAFAAGRNAAVAHLSQPHVADVHASREEGIKELDAATAQFIEAFKKRRGDVAWRLPQVQRRFEIMRKHVVEQVPQSELAKQYGIRASTVGEQMMASREDLWPYLGIAGRRLLAYGSGQRGMANPAEREAILTAPTLSSKRAQAAEKARERRQRQAAAMTPEERAEARAKAAAKQRRFREARAARATT